MKIEQADEALGRLAGRVFDVAEWLTGEEPTYRDGWYQSGSPFFIYFRIVGVKARKYPPNCVHVVAKQSELLSKLEPMVGNNLWGRPDYSVTARPGRPVELAKLLEFIGCAYRATDAA